MVIFLSTCSGLFYLIHNRILRGGIIVLQLWRCRHWRWHCYLLWGKTGVSHVLSLYVLLAYISLQEYKLIVSYLPKSLHRLPIPVKTKTQGSLLLWTVCHPSPLSRRNQIALSYVPIQQYPYMINILLFLLYSTYHKSSYMFFVLFICLIVFIQESQNRDHTTYCYLPSI